jgi:hypothetical protein
MTYIVTGNISLEIEADDKDSAMQIVMDKFNDIDEFGCASLRIEKMEE